MKKENTRVKREKREKMICDLYVSGDTVPDIMKKTGVKETTLFNILKRNEIELRGRTFSARKHKEVIDLYSSNKFTIKDIMKKTGVKSEQTIYRILREGNVSLKRCTI